MLSKQYRVVLFYNNVNVGYPPNKSLPKGDITVHDNKTSALTRVRIDYTM